MIFILKISLNDSNPEIFRTIMVDAEIPLLNLHCAIQTSFGWTNSHLHSFMDAEGKRFGINYGDSHYDEMEELDYISFEVELCDLVSKKGDSLQYIYDWGDYWDHTVVVESVILLGYEFPGIVCLAGEYPCPPEDVGGTDGFYNMLAILKDPTHEEYENYIEWLGKKFINKKEIKLYKINQKLGKPLCGLPKWM